MKQTTTELLNVTGVATSGEGALINTSDIELRGDAQTEIRTGEVSESKARVMLDCTVLTGTNMAVDIVAVIGGIDTVIASFANVTSALSNETLVIDCCPVELKVVYTETAITAFDAKVFCVRF